MRTLLEDHDVYLKRRDIPGRVPVMMADGVTPPNLLNAAETRSSAMANVAHAKQM